MSIIAEAREDRDIVREQWIDVVNERLDLKLTIEGMEAKAAKLKAELNLLRG